MIIEKFLKGKNIIDNSIWALLLGFIIPIIAFITSYLLFYQVKHLVGISTILFTVVIAVPVFNKIFIYEEKIEKKNLGFIKKHKSVLYFFLYFFIGTFIIFFILSFLFPEQVFNSYQLYGEKYQSVYSLREQYASSMHFPPFFSKGELVIDIFVNNISVMFICFVLSLFYGAGAIFLITLNSSIFASELVKVIQVKIPATFNFFTAISYQACNTGVMFLHMVPEVGAYLIAAIAGGILSKAIVKEEIRSKAFLKMLKTAAVLIVIALVILLLAALIESYVSFDLFYYDLCSKVS